MHRVENLYSAMVVRRFLDLLLRLAAERPVRFVVHGPTRDVLARRGALEPLQRAGVDLRSLAPHGEFTSWLRAAPFVVTDGGSIQEECALLGVPTLLWRARSERPDGIGANIVLSRYDQSVIDAFVADPERLRRPAADLSVRPSARILEVLEEELAAATA
jgi:UDP-N-acetylglucosamine 2-epimerase (non-hydrolysing)